MAVHRKEVEADCEDDDGDDNGGDDIDHVHHAYPTIKVIISSD